MMTIDEIALNTVRNHSPATLAMIYAYVATAWGPQPVKDVRAAVTRLVKARKIRRWKHSKKHYESWVPYALSVGKRKSRVRSHRRRAKARP